MREKTHDKKSHPTIPREACRCWEAATYHDCNYPVQGSHPRWTARLSSFLEHGLRLDILSLMALEIYTSYIRRERTDDLRSLNNANEFLDLDEDPNLFSVTSQGNSALPFHSLMSLEMIQISNWGSQATESPDKDFLAMSGIVSRVDSTLPVTQAIHVTPTEAGANQVDLQRQRL
ncbi:hypothetical protein Tco_0614666 [Tanacetum coccineum]